MSEKPTYFVLKLKPSLKKLCNFSVLYFFSFFQLFLKGREQDSLKSQPRGFLEAGFLIGAWSILLLLMLQDEKEGEQKLE